jgi:hypothetical protein
MNTAYSNIPGETFTYLEFGSISPQIGNKQVYEFRTHSQAYDWLMHARYSNDIYTYEQMRKAILAGQTMEAAELYSNNQHHTDDFSFNLNKLIALSLSPKESMFFELGQTLFGCIDGIETVQKYLQSKGIAEWNSDTHCIQWHGFDISDFFNVLAAKMHSSYVVVTTSVQKEIPQKIDVFFAKGITLLYAIRSADELFNLIERSDITLFDYSLSLGKSEETSIGTGKDVKYLSLKEFMVRRKKYPGQIYIRGHSGTLHSKDRLYIEGICGSKENIKAFIAADKKIRKDLKNNYPEESQLLLHNNSTEYQTWIPLEELVSKYE